MGYFRELPEINYVSLLPNRNRNDERILVKNIFKRAKLREDLNQGITVFDYYQIEYDTRPDTVAHKVYGDSELDWVILITNNITNLRDQWPISQNDLHNYMVEKYGETGITGVHHYETTEVRNTDKTIIVPAGLEVPKNYSIEFYDSRLETTTTVSNITTEITNYTYENKIEDEKRNIFVLKPNYVNIILNDMEDAMTYKEGSTQYVSETLVRGENIVIYS